MPPRDPICPRCGGERPYRKKYCLDCQIEARKESARRYRQTTKGKAAFHYNLITGRYNLTMTEYETLLTKQGNVCAICKRVAKLHVDHDHACCPGIESCGQCVRGLLCALCNKGLGLFRDSVDFLDSAKEYLSK